MRFSKILKTAFFAVLLMFGLSNAHAVTNCPSGTTPQENVFQRHLTDCGIGISNNTSFTQVSTPVSEGDGSWTSYFQDFRIKGRAYCSTTAPTNPANENAPCAAQYPRQPMAETINTTTPGGTHCWCQATEHQRYSTVSRAWTAPFQRIDANYVYLRDMGDDCENSCAKYCSYVGTRTKLDPDPASRFYAQNLRATIYDSVKECKSIENKITYYDKTESGELDIIDYVYYSGSVTLKEALERTGFIFKGWCVGAETCSNPLVPGSVQTGWSGEKTLYAQWERSGCETGLKVIYNNDGTVSCSTECEEGYEPQVNPFYSRFTGRSGASWEVAYCEQHGAVTQINGRQKGQNWDWHANFSSQGRSLWGDAFCSTTEPIPSTAKDGYPCSDFGYLAPIAEEIDTENYGENCWCKLTGYEHRFNNTEYPYGVHEMDANYVSVGQANKPFSCANKCPELCKNALYALAAFGKRLAIYRSLKKCVKGKYTLTFKDDETDTTYEIMPDYSVTDTITLPEPSKEGYTFAGWCEDVDNCDSPLIGKQSGMTGTKTLHAKWTPTLYTITYDTSMPKTAQTVYSVEDTVILEAPDLSALNTYVDDSEASITTNGTNNQQPSSGRRSGISRLSGISLLTSGNGNDDNTSGTWVFEGWEDTETHETVTQLPSQSRRSGNVQLTARVSFVPSSSTSNPTYIFTDDYSYSIGACEAGYNRQNASTAVLDPSINSRAELMAYKTSGGDVMTKSSKHVSVTKLGSWGMLFAEGYNSKTTVVTNPFYWVYGESSCNTAVGGDIPPASLKYPDSNNYDTTMNGQDNSGQNCWCKMTDYQIYNQEKQSNLSTPWVFINGFNSKDECASECSPRCAAAMVSNAFFRAQIFDQYSACKPEEYTITYELNGGHWTGNEPETTYTIVYHDVTVPNTLAREGFEFAGWCEGVNDPKSSSCHEANETLKIPTGSSGNKTYYARWKTSLSFNAGTVNVANNVPFPMTPKNVYYKETNITLPQNTFNRTGYNFIGWKCTTKDDGNNDVILEYPDQGTITSYDYNSGMTCTAQWDPIRYDIHYNSHNANVLFDSNWYNTQTFSYTIESDQIDISGDATSEDTHYEFAGWCVGENDNCDDNELVQTYTIPSGSTGDVYLWAHWRSTTYNITYYEDIEDYNADPKVPLTSEQITSYGLPATYTYGTEQELPSLTREHYNFLGWYYADDLNGDPITSIVVGMEGNKILIAQWEPKTYTITYYKDSTKTDTYTGGEYVTSYTVEDSDITPLPTPTETYFQFDGWTNCNDNVVIDTIYTAAGGDRELCAIWTRVSCPDDNYLVDQTCYSCATETNELYPYANGTTATDISACYTTCPPTPTCPEHSENCAYDSYVGENNINYYHAEDSEMLLPCGVTYDCMEHYHPDASGTKCEPDTYNVTYYDGETSIEALSDDFGSYTYGEGLTLPTAENIKDYYNKPHYTFVGWHANQDLTDEAVTEISAEDYGSKVFYSKWEATVYKIRFMRGDEGDGGTMNYQEAGYEQPVTLNPNGFTATGHTFDKWHCTATDENGEPFESDYQDEGTIASYIFDSDMECTAKWSPNPYNLTYDCNGGTLTASNDTVTVYYNREYVLDSSVCEKDNYTISSWSCTNGFDPSSSSKWNITDNSTCTANWTEKEYTITYKEKDGTILSNLIPNKYLASQTPVENVPTNNPSAKAHFEFVGWCDDANLTENCALTRNIPSGTSGNITFYAKWNASECPAGQYLNNGQCSNCESPFTSDAWTATQATDCYYDCNVVCPDNATCEFTGLSNGLIHYGSGISISECTTKMTFECERGYTKNSLSCLLNTYTINYHNMNDADWEDNAIHPTSYTVKSSLITISEPVRDWYRFDGWCIGSDNCASPVKSFVIDPTTTLDDIDLYAQWTFTSCPTGYKDQDSATGTTCVPRQYNITYVDGGQALPGLAATFTVEDTEIRLPSLTKEDYTFDGWCVNNSSCAPEEMVSGTITRWTSLGNKTLYAQWTENKFVCESNKFLHIGDDTACLSTEKITSPSFGVGQGNKTYYLQMTMEQPGKTGLRMNENSNKQLNVMYKGDVYNVHDASIKTK